VLAGILHATYETFVLPTFFELSLMMIWGVLIQWICIKFWQVGIQYGHFGMVNSLSYLVPVFSVALLVITGYTNFTIQLSAATLLVTAAVYLSSQGVIAKDSEMV